MDSLWYRIIYIEGLSGTTTLDTTFGMPVFAWKRKDFDFRS